MVPDQLELTPGIPRAPVTYLAHMRQIAELVGAVRFYPNLGLYSKFYKVNP